MNLRHMLTGAAVGTAAIAIFVYFKWGIGPAAPVAAASVIALVWRFKIGGRSPALRWDDATWAVILALFVLWMHNR